MNEVKLMARNIKQQFITLININIVTVHSGFITEQFRLLSLVHIQLLKQYSTVQNPFYLLKRIDKFWQLQVGIFLSFR